MTRVTITKKQLETEIGRKLVNFIKSISIDGKLTEIEINDLNILLAEINQDQYIPSVIFLKETLTDIFKDGKVDDIEKYNLMNSLCRVLPKEERDKITPNIQYTFEQIKDLATDRQKQYIKDLGGNWTSDMTKEEASNLIENLIEKRPTNRQIMVLRFWNRLDLMDAGIDGVSEWLDEFYGEDIRRREAWELWKQENNDDGGKTHERINTVLVGIGYEYLNRIPTISRSKKKINFLMLIFIVVLTIILTLFLIKNC